MQKVTSIPTQVALNAAPENKGKIGTYTVSWDNVKKPAGDNILAKIANAVVEVLKNIAKITFNTAVWVPNKIHSLLYPNAANAVAAPSDDDIVIEQDSVIIKIIDDSDDVNAAADLQEPTIIEIEENLPEPVATNSSWMKAAVIGTAVAAVGAGLLVAASRYNVEVPYFKTPVPGAQAVDTFLTATIPGAAQSAWSATTGYAGQGKDAFCGFTGFCATSAPAGGAGSAGGAPGGAGSAGGAPGAGAVPTDPTVPTNGPVNATQTV